MTGWGWTDPGISYETAVASGRFSLDGVTHRISSTARSSVIAICGAEAGVQTLYVQFKMWGTGAGWPDKCLSCNNPPRRVVKLGRTSR